MLRGVKCQDNIRIQSEAQFFPVEEKLWKKIFTGYSRRELKVDLIFIKEKERSLKTFAGSHEKIEKILCLTLVERSQRHDSGGGYEGEQYLHNIKVSPHTTGLYLSQ